ncbi:hypothetical protein JXM67_05370 [candidate division WOR-3 bacterium]|nr:hypothetical protein [candidate division WOR-3 bacterium]
MKRIFTIVLVFGVIAPFGMYGAKSSKKVYPMMMGPKVSVGLFEGDESLYPVTVSGDMLLNLYKNYLWLRTDPIALVIADGGDRFSINTGAPFDFVFMGLYKGWRPYGFGGFQIDVTATGENTFTFAGLDLGGGVSYEVSKGLHIFGETGIDLDYLNSALGDDLNFRLFIALGARFAFIW